MNHQAQKKKVHNKPAALFDIKSCQWPLLAFLPKTLDMQALTEVLLQQFNETEKGQNFFDDDAVLIDFSSLTEEPSDTSIEALIRLLKKIKLLPIAAKGGSLNVMQKSREKGLISAVDALPYRSLTSLEQPEKEIEAVIQEVPAEAAATGKPTLVIDKPLRSGQKIYARNSDLVVLAMVNQGAEVIADGNIHVYAPLRGKAMAGARGNTAARIFSLCLEPELVSIAGIYRTSENELPEAVRSKPAQIRLVGEELDKLLIEPLLA